MIDEAVVLVGGFGTRLREAVPDVPKPLAPVAGRPFLAWVLDHLSEAGLRRVILATGYMAERIGMVAGSRWGRMTIAYSHEDEPLGTGGALRKAAAMLSGQGAHVMNGDTFLRYSPAELERTAHNLGVAACIALAEVDDVSRYGAVQVSECRVRGFLEKGSGGPGLINAGCYFLSARGLQMLPERHRFSLEHDLLPVLADKGELAAVTATSDFIDIGVPEDYERAQARFTTV